MKQNNDNLLLTDFQTLTQTRWQRWKMHFLGKSTEKWNKHLERGGLWNSVQEKFICYEHALNVFDVYRGYSIEFINIKCHILMHLCLIELEFHSLVYWLQSNVLFVAIRVRGRVQFLETTKTRVKQKYKLFILSVRWHNTTG